MVGLAAQGLGLKSRLEFFECLQVAVAVAQLELLKNHLGLAFVAVLNPVWVAEHGQFAVQLLDVSLLLLVERCGRALLHGLVAMLEFFKRRLRSLCLLLPVLPTQLGMALCEAALFGLKQLAQQLANGMVLLLVKGLHFSLHFGGVGLQRQDLMLQQLDLPQGNTLGGICLRYELAASRVCCAGQRCDRVLRWLACAVWAQGVMGQGWQLGHGGLAARCKIRAVLHQNATEIKAAQAACLSKVTTDDGLRIKHAHRGVQGHAVGRQPGQTATQRREPLPRQAGVEVARNRLHAQADP